MTEDDRNYVAKPSGENEDNPELNKPRFVQIPFERWTHLERDAMLNKVELELSERLKRRFTLILVAVAVTSFFGIQGLAFIFINQQLTPQIDQVKEATAKAKAEANLVSRSSQEAVLLAQSAQTKAQEALSVAQNQTTKVNELLNSLDKRAKDLEVRITKVRASSENVRSQLEISVQELERRFKVISAAAPAAAPPSSETVEESLASFKKNSEYEIDVNVFGNSPTPKSEEIVRRLRELGFVVSLDHVFQDKENETDRVTVSFTEKGRPKLDFVIAYLRSIANLKVDPNRDARKELVGDIQINFQSL